REDRLPEHPLFVAGNHARIVGLIFARPHEGLNGINLAAGLCDAETETIEAGIKDVPLVTGAAHPSRLEFSHLLGVRPAIQAGRDIFADDLPKISPFCLVAVGYVLSLR